MRHFSNSGIECVNFSSNFELEYIGMYDFENSMLKDFNFKKLKNLKKSICTHSQIRALKGLVAYLARLKSTSWLL